MSPLKLNGSTSGFVALDAPAAAGSNTLVLPTGNGSNGQVLTTNGSGTLSWSTIAASQWTTSGSDIYYTTGKVLVGASTSTGINPSNVGRTIAPLIQISGDGASTTAAASLQITDTANSDWSLGANIQLVKDAGSTAPGNGWALGGIFISGEDTSGTLKTGASIVAKADGQSWASGDCPARLEFSTTADGASSPTERMRIHNTGDVSIGSTAADGRLYVAKANGTTDVVKVENTSGSGNCAGIISTFSSNGNNTSSWHFRGFTGGVGFWYLYGNGTTSYTSDARKKKNVETTRDGYLEDLNKLRVVKYNWITDEDQTPKELGLIAQEVEEVFPGLVQTGGKVSEEDDFEVKVLKGSVLPVMLLKALQEATKRIETLEANNAALEARLSALEVTP